MSLPKSTSNLNMENQYNCAAFILQGLYGRNLVQNDTIFPNWIEDVECFWYEHSYRKSDFSLAKQYRLVEARTADFIVAFDHISLGKTLSEKSGVRVNPDWLPIKDVVIKLAPVRVSFTAFGKSWEFNESSQVCDEISATPSDWVISPNGKLAIYCKDNNLFLRNLKCGDEKRLTDDGETCFEYGAVGTAWGCPVDSGLQAIWSPDSKSIFTVQRDTRRVKNLSTVCHVPVDGSLRPKLINSRVAYPGDKRIEEYRLLVIDILSNVVIEADYRRIPTCRNGWGFFNAKLGWWADDSRHAYFIDQERGDKEVRVVEFDTRTGSCQVMFQECSDTHVNLSLNSEDYPAHVYLPSSNELIWHSERNGWAHLFLYDLNNGALKSTITSGDWVVRNVLHFDASRRELFIQTAGRVVGRDPYYRDVCRVNIDTGEITTLLSSNDEYIVHTSKSLLFQMAKGAKGWDIGRSTSGICPAGRYIVATLSTVAKAPITILADYNGKLIGEIATADVSSLPEGWQWPESVRLLAADGKTDIYGLIFRPSNFSEENSYPVINYLCAGPDVPSVSKGSFINSESNAGNRSIEASALAELGFIVIMIDGRGTAYRSKDFSDYSYGWIPNSAFLEDQEAGLSQLFVRYPYMDSDRVGVFSVYGAIGGIYCMLQRPDFYKVGVINCLQDSRLMGGPVWSEKYEGVSSEQIHSSSKKIDRLFPEQLASNLKGKLLLMHGMLDVSTPVASTFRMVEALHKANKDFDMFLLPNVGHDPSEFTCRAWNYFVEHLLGEKPPRDFVLKVGRIGQSVMLDLDKAQ